MESRIKDLHDKWFKGLHARPELNNDKKYNRLFYIIKVLQACESDLVITDNHDYKTPYILVMDFIEYNLDLMKDGNNPVSDFEIDNIYIRILTNWKIHLYLMIL